MIELIERIILKLLSKNKTHLHNLIIFKTEKQRKEWEDERLDQKLKFIVEAAALISWSCFGKHLTITEIFRTQEENNEIYGDTKHKSLHTYWHAIDIRTRDYTKSEAKILHEILSCIPYKKGSKIKTSVYGIKKHYDHIHAQTAMV
jgi:hypothetical protein